MNDRDWRTPVTLPTDQPVSESPVCCLLSWLPSVGYCSHNLVRGLLRGHATEMLYVSSDKTFLSHWHVFATTRYKRQWWSAFLSRYNNLDWLITDIRSPKGMISRIVAWNTHYSARAVVIQNIWSHIDRYRRSRSASNMRKRVACYNVS